MKITYIILAILVTVLALYFLVNIFSPKQNKLNSLLRIESKNHALLYFALTILVAPALAFGVKHEQELELATSHGFSTYQAYLDEVAKASSFNLTLTQYQTAMNAARKDGYSSYVEHQQFLEAKAHDYDNYADYSRDSKLAKSYGFPLKIYRKTKAEADAKNFEYFDDYLAHIEQEKLTKKLENVANLEGDYNIESVPLGIKKNELLSLIDDCKISQIPDYSFPVSNTLAPRNDAHVSHFFPETQTNNNFGLTAYSMNFKVMPGLDRQAITKFEMKCESSRYDLWFLKSDETLVMYEKTIHLPSIRRYEKTVERIEGILTAKCDDNISIGLEKTFEEHGERQITNLYCKNFQDYIIATIVDGPIIAGVRQDPDIHIGYLNDRLWKKYINNLHAAKGKKRSVTFSQNRNRNQTKTIENSI